MKFNVHAGHNPDGKIACGAVGLIKESTEARKVAKYVIKYLKKAGHTVYDCTVNNGKNQSDVLKKIIAKCNAHKVDLDISIHFNIGAKDAKGNGETTGAEVLIYALNQKPRSVANHVVNEIAKLGLDNRGVKARPELAVLNATNAQALLIECLFLDDKDDIKVYNAKKMAQAIVVGILNSYGVTQYETTRKVTSFTAKLKKVGTVQKNKTCNIDKFKFVNGYMLAHRKKADNWVKMKYLKLK